MKRFLSAVLAASLILSLAACGAPSPTHSGGSSASSAGSAQAAGSSAASSSVDPTSSGGDAHTETPSGGENQAGASAGSTPVTVPEPQPPTPQELARERLSSMTLEEKVGQLFFARCPVESAAEDAAAYHLGGYILFGRDFKGKTANEIIQTVASYQDAAASDTGIPLLIGADEEGGTVVRASSNGHLRSQRFASPQNVYASGGMAAVTADTLEKDRLLQALGVNVNLAPVADVSTDPNDFIYTRAFGQNAAATAEYVRTVVSRMAADSMGSVLKHFPGYGNNVDTHTGIALDARPMEAFEASDFLPFTAGIDAGGDTTAVLVSHNIVACMDNVLPASLSPAVHTILREQLEFDGVIMTDDLAMDAVAAYAANGSAATMALLAGNDLIISSDHRTHIPQVIEAVNTGVLSESVIDDACVRVLLWKHALGLLELAPAA